MLKLHKHNTKSELHNDDTKLRLYNHAIIIINIFILFFLKFIIIYSYLLFVIECFFESYIYNCLL